MFQYRLICLVICSVLVAQPALSVAKDDALDIDVVGKSVSTADPGALLEGLESPPRNRLLPDGFLNPRDGEPQYPQIIDELTVDTTGMLDFVGNASLPFDTDPDTIDGLLSTGVLTYLVTTNTITPGDIDDFEQGLSEGLDDGSNPATTSDIERIDFNGMDAILATVVSEESGVTAVVQMVAVPVGSTFVIGTVVVADQGNVRERPVRHLAESLTESGIEHLARVAEVAPQIDPDHMI